MNLAGQFPPYRPAAEDDLDPGASLLQIKDFVGRQWRLIALVTALVIVVWAAYIAITPYRYTAQADMIIDTKRVSWTQSEMASENRTVEDASVESEIGLGTLNLSGQGLA
jgi:polysaccharide biosynthesis transport protein